MSTLPEHAMATFAVPAECGRLSTLLLRARDAVRAVEAEAAALILDGRHEADAQWTAHALAVILGAAPATRTRLLGSPRAGAWLRAVRLAANVDCLDDSTRVGWGCSLGIDALRGEHKPGTIWCRVATGGRIALDGGRSTIELGDEYEGRAARLTVGADAQVQVSLEGLPTMSAEPGLGRAHLRTAESGAFVPVVPWDDLVNRAFVMHDVDPVEGPAATKWRTQVIDSKECLAAAGGPWLDLVERLVEFIVPVRSPEKHRLVSGSSNVAPGAVAASFPPTPEKMGEMLVHEQQHIRLDLLLDVVPLIEPEKAEPRLRSPWRRDLRPPLGLLHGIVAFSGVSSYWNALREHDPAWPATSNGSEARTRAGQVLEAIAVLRSAGVLNAEGATVVDGAQAAMAEILR